MIACCTSQILSMRSAENGTECKSRLAVEAGKRHSIAVHPKENVFQPSQSLAASVMVLHSNATAP